jgi:hypothetical protein
VPRSQRIVPDWQPGLTSPFLGLAARALTRTFWTGSCPRDGKNAPLPQGFTTLLITPAAAQRGCTQALAAQTARPAPAPASCVSARGRQLCSVCLPQHRDLLRKRLPTPRLGAASSQRGTPARATKLQVPANMSLTGAGRPPFSVSLQNPPPHHQPRQAKLRTLCTTSHGPPYSQERPSGSARSAKLGANQQVPLTSCGRKRPECSFTLPPTHRWVACCSPPPLCDLLHQSDHPGRVPRVPDPELRSMTEALRATCGGLGGNLPCNFQIENKELEGSLKHLRCAPF